MKQKLLFILVGSNIKKYPELAHAITSAGHEVGNHTSTHSGLPFNRIPKNTEF